MLSTRPPARRAQYTICARALRCAALRCAAPRRRVGAAQTGAGQSRRRCGWGEPSPGAECGLNLRPERPAADRLARACGGQVGAEEVVRDERAAAGQHAVGEHMHRTAHGLRVACRMRRRPKVTSNGRRVRRHAEGAHAITAKGRMTSRRRGTGHHGKCNASVCQSGARRAHMCASMCVCATCA